VVAGLRANCIGDEGKGRNEIIMAKREEGVFATDQKGINLGLYLLGTLDCDNSCDTSQLFILYELNLTTLLDTLTKPTLPIPPTTSHP
jgi:hypothetical protein